jgi:hypothetical protein
MCGARQCNRRLDVRVAAVGVLFAAAFLVTASGASRPPREGGSR